MPISARFRLTEKSIATFRYEGSGRSLDCRWDSEVPGLGVRVQPTGSKSFVIWYRARGRVRYHTLGKWGQLTLKKARKLAKEQLGRIATGVDPAGERQDAREQAANAKTVADLSSDVLEWTRARRKESTASEYEGMFRRYVLPRWSRKKVDEITRADVARLYQEMSSTPVAANRTLLLLHRAFSLAEIWGWIPEHSNPATGIKPEDRYSEKPRERFLDAAELARLYATLTEAENSWTAIRRFRNGTSKTEPFSPGAIAAIRLLMATGCRLSEILGARWEDVDLEHLVLHLPDSKTGKGSVYLSEEAAAIFRGIERVEGNPYVIASRRKKSSKGEPVIQHMTDIRKPWLRIREAAGLGDDVTLHTLRHSFVSLAIACGESPTTAGELVLHASLETTERYYHPHVARLREAARRMGENLAFVLETGELPPSPGSPDVN